MDKKFVFTLIIFLILTMPLAINAADPPATNDGLILKINLTKDLVTFIKAAIWVFGIFVAILAFLGVAFFGFDVRKARAALQDSLKELKEITEQARELKKSIDTTQNELNEMKTSFIAKAKEAEDRIEELGSRVEELAETQEGPPERSQPDTERSVQDLITDIIRNSSFEWTTIKRIIKKTGLSREGILEAARDNSNIEIGFGRKGKDHIFKLIN